MFVVALILALHIFHHQHGIQSQSGQSVEAAPYIKELWNQINGMPNKPKLLLDYKIPTPEDLNCTSKMGYE